MRYVLTAALIAGVVFMSGGTAPTPGADAATFAVTNLNDSGAGSLRAAMQTANGTPGPDTIELNVQGTINLLTELPFVTTPMTILGPGPQLLTIDATNTPGVGTSGFHVFPGANPSLNLSGVTVKGGPGNGVIVSFGTSAMLHNVVLSTSNFGVQNLGTATITNSVLSNHVFGTVLNGGTLDIMNSTLEGSRDGAIINCGAACGGPGVLRITKSTIRNNGVVNPTLGGAIFMTDGTVTLTDTAIDANKAILGGGVFTLGGTLTLTQGTITNNVSTVWGGGVFMLDGTTSITNTSISGNSAEASGGGIIYLPPPGGPLTVAGATVSPSNVLAGVLSGRLATLDGIGGFSHPTLNRGATAATSSSLTLRNSTVSSNTALSAGGINNGAGANLIIENSTINNNRATGTTIDARGGGISTSGTTTITNSTIAGNSAGGPNGGGIFHCRVNCASKASTTLNNVTIAGNTAPAGGGLAADGPGVVVRNTLVANNNGGNCAGALVSQGNSLDSTSTCGFLSAGDKQNANPMLGALANDGGPTQTLALFFGSPAIEAGANCPASDQRGFFRPRNGNGDGVPICDIGAFEFQPEAGTAGSGGPSVGLPPGAPGPGGTFGPFAPPSPPGSNSLPQDAGPGAPSGAGPGSAGSGGPGAAP